MRPAGRRRRFNNFGAKTSEQTIYLQAESRMPTLELVRAVKLEDYPLAKFCNYEIPRGQIRLKQERRW